MTKFKLLGVAAILSTVTATPVFAQAAISEPEAFQAMYPNRDVLNGGALTPASRMGLELRDGAGSGSYARAPAEYRTRALAKHH